MGNKLIRSKARKVLAVQETPTSNTVKTGNWKDEQIIVSPNGPKQSHDNHQATIVLAFLLCSITAHVLTHLSPKQPDPSKGGGYPELANLNYKIIVGVLPCALNSRRQTKMTKASSKV